MIAVYDGFIYCCCESAYYASVEDFMSVHQSFKPKHCRVVNFNTVVHAGENLQCSDSVDKPVLTETELFVTLSELAECMRVDTE